MSKTFSGLFKKLKSIKHIEIILAVLFGLIVLLVYFSTTNALTSSTNSTNSSLSGVSAYTSEIEQKLENLLCKINGAGNVEVMVMCEDNIKLETDTVPKLVSVVVVASGADDVFVKLNIIRAVQALINLDTANIEVLSGSTG